MSAEMERAQRIKETMGTSGWRDILAILDEQIADPKDRLYAIMSSRPDTLTGKAAIRLASRSKALIDFRESIEDALKPLENSPQPARAGNGRAPVLG